VENCDTHGSNSFLRGLKPVDISNISPMVAHSPVCEYYSIHEPYLTEIFGNTGTILDFWEAPCSAMPLEKSHF
jgi:hypothetical protein